MSGSLIEEVPIAIVCNDITLAVMMATPNHLQDFITGFCWTEGVTSRPLQPGEFDILERPNGIECRIHLSDHDALIFRRRMRQTVSPSACGLCGVRSLAQAVPVPASVGGESFRMQAALIKRSVTDLRAAQPLHDRTRSAHAAAFLVPGDGIVAVREDIGRHNALDKLVGALLGSGTEPSSGAVLLTSRVSVEMVQKVAALGAPAIIAVSAPSALGVRVARAAGITLVGSVRPTRYTVYTNAWRIGGPADTDPSARPPIHLNEARSTS